MGEQYVSVVPGCRASACGPDFRRMRLVVAAGTLWVLFATGVLLNVVGQRRLMRVADGLLAVEFAALVATSSLDSDGAAAVTALVVCPSVTGGFLAHCLQRAVRAARRDPGSLRGAR